MTTTQKRKPLPTHAQLARQLLEANASRPLRYKLAHKDLEKAGEALFASGVVVHLTKLGGADAVAPFLIVDGLSPATIAALRADIVRSWKQIQYEPPGDADQ